MLTATDVHYLLGFLTLMSSPSDVDIILGDLIYDEAPDEIRNQLSGDSTVVDSEGNQFPGFKTVRDLIDSLEVLALNEENVHKYVESLVSGHQETISINVRLPDEIYVKLGNDTIRLKDAFLVGSAMRV